MHGGSDACLKTGPLAGSRNTIRRSAASQLISVSISPRSSAEWVSKIHAALYATCAALTLNFFTLLPDKTVTERVHTAVTAWTRVQRLTEASHIFRQFLRANASAVSSSGHEGFPIRKTHISLLLDATDSVPKQHTSRTVHFPALYLLAKPPLQKDERELPGPFGAQKFLSHKVLLSNRTGFCNSARRHYVIKCRPGNRNITCFCRRDSVLPRFPLTGL